MTRAIYAFALLLACSDEPAPEVTTEDALDIASNDCLGELVSRETPNTCAPAGNSPVSSEIRYVPHVGFMDGTSCGAWPRSLTYAQIAQAVNGDLVSNAVTEDAIWMQQRSSQVGVEEWVVFGTKRELVVMMVPGTRQDDYAVAVDLATGYGTLLDPRYTCSEADERAGECSPMTGTIDGREVQLLARNEATTAPRNVMLVAESVWFPESIDIRVNLAIMAPSVTGGPRSRVESRTGRTDEGVEIRVLSKRMGIPPSWDGVVQSMQLVPSRPLLAVFADAVSGIEKMETRVEAPVATLELVNTTNPLAVAHQSSDEGRVVQATFSRLIPRGESFSSTHTGEEIVTYSHHVSVQFGNVPQVRLEVPGGVTQLGTVEPFTTDLAANGEHALRVKWDQADIDAFAAALVDDLINHYPTGCQYNTKEECWVEPYCDYYPDGSVQCGEETRCVQVQKGICHQRGDFLVSFLGGGPARFASNTAPAVIAASIAGGIDALLTNRYPAPEGPTRLPAGFVRGETGFVGTNFAAHVMSRGALFDVLYDAADNRSRRHGRPTEEWEGLGMATDRQVLIPPLTVGDYGLDGAKWRDAQRWRVYVDNFAAGSPVHLNALGHPYGRRVAGMHPTHLASGLGSYGSMIELSERWSGLTEMAKELDEIADDQDFLSLIDDLIDVTGAHLDLTHDAATALSDAASANAAEQAAAIDKLQEVGGEINTLQQEFATQMTEVWGCPSGINSCPEAINALAAELTEQCEATNSLGSVVEILGKLASIAGTVVPVVSAVGAVLESDAVGDLIESAAQAASGGAFDGEKIKAGLKWIADQKDNVKKAQSTLKKLRGIAEKIGEMIGDAVPSCEGTPIEAQLRQLQADVAFMDTIGGMLDMQTSVLDGVLLALSAHLEHQLSSARTYDVWADGSTHILGELSELEDETMDQLERQRRFLGAACRTTQLASTQAYADYKAISDTLVTLAGRDRTAAHLVIPRSPALSNQLVTDREDGLLLSVWDVAAFSSFDESGGLGTPAFLTEARSRFGEFVSQQICEVDSTPLSPHRFLIRKTLSGLALADFLSTGRGSIDVTLDDVLRGGEGSGVAFSAVQSVPLAGSPYDLSGPVLLNVGYSACTGPAEDPCCTGRDCRATLPQDAPHLVQRQTSVPTLDCAADTLAVHAILEDADLDVETCLAPVAVHPAHVELIPISNPSADDASLLFAHVDTPFCVAAPDALSMVQMRGLPAIGTYEVALNGQVAYGLTRELLDGAVTVPPEWLDAVEGVTGLELFFFVGVEALRAGAVYDLDPTTVVVGASDLSGG